ncbi:MAG: tRNA adenosine(34) deaminase TadA [Candidatus Omnitrophica bacterium]|nr:tRNA adenosine(34) deaminase TadA [Candidatus Omnitrophota bacterium]
MLVDLDIKFMREALKQAKFAYEKEEVPVGAVITLQNKVITKGYNQVELLNDPTAHAEILVITQACSYLKSKWLENCTLYVTIEPCLMCAGALVLSRIPRIVFGAFDPKAGAFGSKIDINGLKLNHQIEAKAGVLEKDCGQILKDFFKQKRAKLN